MTWEYRECDVLLEVQPERQLMHWLRDGWELVGLHRKNRRGKQVVVAILRRNAESPASMELQLA
ncbi:MAG TPA: hypothetical protein VK009_27070 [Chloroflexota bacterium]|nr:hypothetical protein [Chloroflexota bacterium]